MSHERETESLRVALLSYDERELRVRKHYLEEQSPAISCTCFQSGEPVLQALWQKKCFDVLVLGSQLEDMDSIEFIEKLNRLPSHPPLLLQGDGWYDEQTAACLNPSGKFYHVERDRLQDLMRGLWGVPGRSSARIERFCNYIYDQWGVRQPDINCSYLTMTVQIVCASTGKLALRKEILQSVAEEYQVTVAAVDSGLRRLIDNLEHRKPEGWLRFKKENGLQDVKVTTGKLVYALRQSVRRRGIIS